MSVAFGEKQQRLGTSIEKMQSVLRYADELQFIPLSSHAFVLAEQALQCLKESEMSARAHLSMFETMGLAAPELQGIWVQLAMKAHWSMMKKGSYSDTQLERQHWERLVLTPTGLHQSLQLLHPIDLPENALHWGILRPYAQEVLRSAQSLLKDSKVFASTVALPKVLYWAPFFGSHLLSYSKSYKFARAEQIAEPAASVPMHLVGLVAQMMQVSLCALELTAERANFEEENAEKSLQELLRGPSVWSSAIEFLELEKIIPPRVSPNALPALGWAGRHRL